MCVTNHHPEIQIQEIRKQIEKLARYLPVRPASYVELTAGALEDSGTDAFLGGLHHLEVEVARNVVQLQIARSLPLQHEITKLLLIN